MSEKRKMIPVWFFVGLLLLTYGILIFVNGLAEWSHPPNTALAYLHPPVWWGGLMILVGGSFAVMFRPKKKS